MTRNREVWFLMWLFRISWMAASPMGDTGLEQLGLIFSIYC